MNHKGKGAGNERKPVSHPAELKNQADWEASLSTVAFLAKSLSDENRLRVLVSLRNGRLSVSASGGGPSTFPAIDFPPSEGT